MATGAHLSLPGASPARTSGRESGVGLTGICLIWLLSSVGNTGAGFVAVAIALALPIARPSMIPPLLLTSFLFYSTMSIPADILYALRAYWVVTGATYFLLVRGCRFSNAFWFVFAFAIALVCYGLFVGSARSAAYLSAHRSAVLEAALALLWVATSLLGYAWLKQSDGVLRNRTLLVIFFVWVISVAYGVAQAIFGLNENTVPPDILPFIVGFQQYEELGRRPFAFLTSNGACVASLMVIPLLLDRKETGWPWAATVFAMGFTVAVLTLTRSYIFLLAAVFFGYGALFARRAAAAVSFWMIGMAVIGVVLVKVDFEDVLLAGRFSGASVGATRVEIWSHVLANKSALDWLLGHGFGSNGWFEFFSDWKSGKQLLSPHSAVLEIGGQLGAAGLLAYSLLIALLARIFFALRNSWVGPGAVVAIGLIMLREQVSASYIFSPSVLSGMFWMLMGILLAQYDAALTHSENPPGESAS